MSEASKTPVWGMAKEDLEIQVVDLRAKLIEALDRAQRAEQLRKDQVSSMLATERNLDATIAEQSSKIAELERALTELVQWADSVSRRVGVQMSDANTGALTKARAILASSGQVATEPSS